MYFGNIIKNIRKNLPYRILFGIYVSIVSVFVFRIFLSVELTDEVHGIASIYHIVQGKVPFMTSWDYHTGWCLQVFLFKIFRYFSPNLEGIVLFFRIAYGLFSLMVIGIVFMLLYSKYKKLSILIFVFPLLFWVPFSICQINYITFPICLLILAAVLFSTANKDAVEKSRYFFMGIFMGLACITYPTLVVMAALFVLLILFFENKNVRIKNMSCYILGGVLVGGGFCFWIFSKGSFSLFVQALNGMLSSPHEKTKGSIDAAFFMQTFYHPMKAYFFRKFTGIIFAYFFFTIFIHRKVKKRKTIWNTLLFILFQIINVCINSLHIGYLAFGSFLGIIPILFALRKEKRKSLSIYIFVLFFFCLTYSFTSDNKNVFAAFESSGSLIVFIIGMVFSEFVFDEYKFSGIALSLLLCFTGIIHFYTYVYRDEPVKQLTEQVSQGIFKGLYTTGERKIFVESSEKLITEEVFNKDKICTATRIPMVYLMAKANICAPQTWDAQFLARGYTSALPLLDYFKAINEMPDVFIASTMDVEDFFGNPKYEINAFIDQYYVLYCEKQMQEVTFYFWRRKDDENINSRLKDNTMIKNILN